MQHPHTSRTDRQFGAVVAAISEDGQPRGPQLSEGSLMMSTVVDLDIDKNGIVSVKAKDLGTQKEQTIVIQSNSGLTDEEIDRMMKDAEANAEADKKRKEEVDLRNEVDQAIFATEKTIKETVPNSYSITHRHDCHGHARPES